MNCLNPIDAAALADYWLAMLTKPEEEAADPPILNGPIPTPAEPPFDFRNWFSSSRYFPSSMPLISLTATET